MDVVLRQDVSYPIDACLNRCLIVRRRVLAKQVLQYVGWHDRVALDCFDEVFANNRPSKVLIDLAV